MNAGWFDILSLSKLSLRNNQMVPNGTTHLYKIQFSLFSEIFLYSEWTRMNENIGNERECKKMQGNKRE